MQKRDVKCVQNQKDYVFYYVNIYSIKIPIIDRIHYIWHVIFFLSFISVIDESKISRANQKKNRKLQ